MAKKSNSNRVFAAYTILKESISAEKFKSIGAEELLYLAQELIDRSDNDFVDKNIAKEAKEYFGYFNENIATAFSRDQGKILANETKIMEDPLENMSQDKLYRIKQLLNC